MLRLRFDDISKLGARLLLAVFLGLLFGHAALAEDPAPKALKGVALVIGNGDYEHLAKLANPPNDARAVEEMLDGLGFETDIVSDRDARRLRRALEGFAEDAEGADVAVVYYSGHGIEAGGENYLVPVDADVAALEDAGEKLVPLSELIDELKKTVPVTIVMLDACRTNPFPPDALVKASPDAPGAPMGSGGLGEARGAVAMTATSATAENFGTVIGFAAEPGHVALDGDPGGNSPYAAAILRHLSAMEGAEFGTVMRMVAEEVYLKTGGRQRPWVNESLRRLLYFGTPAPQPAGADGEILVERRQLLLTIAALPELGRKQIETLAQSGGVPMDALYGMLKALGTEAPSDPAELDRLMRSQTERLKSMLAERDALQSSDPEIARLSAQADGALREGALEVAVRLLGEAKQRVASLADTVDEAEAQLAAKRREFAAVYARSGEANFLRFDFRQAASDYAQAYDQIARWDEKLASTYRYNRMKALEQQGTLRGDNEALNGVVSLGDAALRDAEASNDAETWISAQNVLGNALFTLGDRDNGPDNLKRAADAYRAALSRSDGLDASLAGKIRNNLANTLTVLGTRQGDDAVLVEAVGLYEKAIDQFEVDQDPVLWASAYINFGKTLIALGELRNSVETLTMAGQAFETALSVTPREQQPLVWGGAQNNIGNVYRALGLRMTDLNIAAGRHVQSVGAYLGALQELTRERVPLQWASVQQNLANAYLSLARLQRDSGTTQGYLRQAEEAQNAALQEMTRERAPSMWANVKLGLGETMQLMAFRAATPEEARSALRSAADAQAQALEIFTKDNAPSTWGNAQVALGYTLQLLSQQEHDPAAKREHLVRAEAIQRTALEAFPKETRPSERAALLHSLGQTLIELGPLEAGTGRYEAAESVFREEQGLLSRDHETARWAASQAGIGNAMRAIGIARGDKAMLVEARQRTGEAKTAIQPFDTSYNQILDGRVAEIDAALATLQ
jgi:uncharacterized caspase-like protein